MSNQRAEAVEWLDCRGQRLPLTGRPLVMGILNVTPDSFSDGGIHDSVAAALEHARRMVDEGCDIIDVGGESTRPGAMPVSVDVELERVIPVIETLARDCPVPISIDTRKAVVMREAVAAGASLINDVGALQGPDALETAATLDVPVCLMHMLGEPATMQQGANYDDVVAEVLTFLRGRVEAALAAGIAREHIVVDPGFGFGKRLEDNLALLRGLSRLEALGLPILVGLSRKSMLGEILDRPIDERLAGSLAAALMATMAGARILRVHDVRETVDVMRVFHAVDTGIEGVHGGERA